MKRIFCMLILTFSLFVMCVAVQVSASSDTWYSISAEEADNPVLLEDNQYFQGVSINSHIISDLTFLKIPFKKYVNQTEKQVQIITFAEAMFTSDGEPTSDVVLYLYAPNDSFSEIDYIETRTELISKDILQENELVDFPLGQRLYLYKWLKISKYGSIYKFSFSSGTTGSYKGDSISEILLDDYNKEQQHTIVSTIFNSRINKINFVDKKVLSYTDLKKNGVVFEKQEFNFIYEKNVEHPEAVVLLADHVETDKAHYITSIGYNETTAKVDGTLFRLRYNQDDVTTSNIRDILGPIYNLAPNEHSYVDYFYYFFNVSDAATDKAWTGKEVITKINYTFYEYLQEYETERKVSFFDGGLKGTIKISYLKPNGEVYVEDITTFESDNVLEQVPSGEYVFSNVQYREPNTLSSIYQTKTIVPGTFSNKFPAKLDSPSIENFFTGYISYIGTLPYVFSTNDEELLQTLNKDINGNVNTSDFQFGMLIGDTGYVATKGNPALIYDYREYQNCVELVSVDDIWYEYQGEKYHATVLETNVDKSNVNKPIIQGSQDLFPSEPDPDREPSLWEKLIQWFKNAWEWIKDNYKVIIFAVCLVLGVILVIKTVRKIQVYRAQKAIIDTSKKQKK